MSNPSKLGQTFDLLSVRSVVIGKMKTFLLLSHEAAEMFESHFKKTKMSRVP